MRTPLYAPLDDALDEIAPYGIELKNGNSNHAPMVAEALCALGHPEAVTPWVARYRERMQLRPGPGEAIRGDEWRGALGRLDRFADWALFFTDELEDAPWRTVLDRWVGRLAPGFCAAATHGPIRVGHAVRGLAERETASRRRELADALAGWAATWQQLPGSDDAPHRTMPPREAIARVPIVPAERRLPGNIVQALAILGDFPAFTPIVDAIDTTGAAAPRIAELTELFARVFLANAHDIPTTIAFIHAVTSHAALGNIAPFVGEATAHAALRYAWQSGCALYACYGGDRAIAETIAATDAGEDRLVERALKNGDEHVIKFTEACLSRHAISPSPAYLAAADHVAAMIRPRRAG
jgi:Questin oxidase-like